MSNKPPLRCAVCLRRRPQLCGGYCACGATVWELIPHEVPPGIVVESLEERSAPLRPTQFSALLSRALGGVVLGLKVLVGGSPGAGKSTLCAELAAQIAAKLDGLGYWLDAEQNRNLVQELFPRTGSSSRHIRLVSRRSGSGSKVGWRDALQAVPPDAAVIVVDSLQRWARSYVEQTTLLETVATMRPTVLVVSHFNKAGQFAGPMGNEYDVDATAIIRPKNIEVTKCRWSLCPRTIERPMAS
ncbi:hypothetical protein [Polyangium fumosum]|uniref:AAA+ ATPase domain-containing protein n=1 Tax=Polyangium fumosum TaxID=889272 RepID=A0A4U1IAK5_9BACT|nr:hypothetical protein [Polyangium fumosum]TKC90542.1 hypothetical protein E8A74_51005 [Polyangium fumosum]